MSGEITIQQESNCDILSSYPVLTFNQHITSLIAKHQG